MTRNSVERGQIVSCYSVPMGAKTGLSVEEYLHTSFPDLDRDYRDGQLVERSLPDYLCGKTQLDGGTSHLQSGSDCREKKTGKGETKVFDRSAGSFSDNNDSK